MSEEKKPKRKPAAKKAVEVAPVEAAEAPKQKETPKALSVAEIRALPADQQRAALELHAQIGDDKKWARVMLNVRKP